MTPSSSREDHPIALKAAAGTQAFRTALRDATENMGRTVLSQGVITYSRTTLGFTTETGVILKASRASGRGELIIYVIPANAGIHRCQLY